MEILSLMKKCKTPKKSSKKIKLPTEEIDYIVISNVNNFNIELKIELSRKNRKKSEIIDFLSTYFKLDYAATCHSSQGLTIDDTTICDVITCT